MKNIFCLIAIFTAFYLFSSCQKEGVSTGGNGGVIVLPTTTYTINCSSPVIAGTYRVGTAASSFNTVRISATSTGAGTFNITTPVVNGVSFNGIGNFAGAATQSIVLTASGTPTAAGPFSYNAIASTGGSNCNFLIDYGSSSTNPVQFITATVDGVATAFNSSISAYYDVMTSKYLFYGQTPSGISVNFAIGNQSVPAGIYNVNGSIYLSFYYINSISGAYVAQTGNNNPTPTFSVTLNNSLTPTMHTTVTGSFTGALKENTNGQVIQITNGAFSVNF